MICLSRLFNLCSTFVLIYNILVVDTNFKDLQTDVSKAEGQKLADNTVKKILEIKNDGLQHKFKKGYKGFND